MREGFSYGGQAVIEGVMMRGRDSVAIAVRKSPNEVILHTEKLRNLAKRYKILRLPIIRGCLALVDSLVLGIRSLNFSASVVADQQGASLGAKELVLTSVLAVTLTVGLFIALPAFVIRNVQTYIQSNVLLNLSEGAIKISFFILYIVAISVLKDIQRVFQYHGAEHKTINCYEAGEELSVENARNHSTVHARCGTNFLLIVFFTSVFIFSFFGRPPLLQRILIHIAILPLVAGVSYELIKRAGSSKAGPLIRTIAKPGLWLQALTTRQPDDSQIEVAIKALRAVLDAERPDQRVVDLTSARRRLGRA